MHFDQPHNLWLLALVPALGLVWAWYLAWKRRVRRRIGNPALIREMSPQASPVRQTVRSVLLLAALACLAVAAARPQWGQTDRAITRTGVDVVFALDLSKSMQARDLPPSRLEAAKDEILGLMQVLGGDRVGLVVFTAISFAQSPLTSDYGAIRFYLRKLQPGQMPFGGTSIGHALTEGVELLTGERLGSGEGDGGQTGGVADMKRAKNQILVLFTDGEDHESDPMAAARVARERGVKVVTVGMGSPSGSRIPIYGPNGKIEGYKRNRAGEIVYSKLDEATLRRVAEATGGIYVPYAGPNSVANALVDYIDRLEKTELETLLRKRYRDRFMLFLVPGLLFGLLALGLGERSTRRWGARRRRWRLAGSAALVCAVAFWQTGCDDLVHRKLGAVEAGNEALEAGEYEEALAHYREAEGQVPMRPALAYDIGRAHLGLEEWDRARDHFTRALETQDVGLRFDATYNLGLALAGEEKWREAHDVFKEALKLAALDEALTGSTRFEQAQRNLEISWRKLYPPCQELEDDLEENDAPAQASQLQELRAQQRALCGLDDDWYAIPAVPGSRITARATFSVLREEPDPEAAFLPRPEDVQIALFDATGETPLAVDQGLRQDETTRERERTARRASREIEGFVVEPGAVPSDQQFVLLKVRAAEELEFKYDLEIESIPPCSALEDPYENNDERGAAAELRAGSHELHHCAGDEDFFVTELRAGDLLFVDAVPAQDAERKTPPELRLELLDASSGRLLARGEADGERLTARLWEVPAGTERVIVRVAGADGDQQGPYRLDLFRYGPCPAGDDRYEDNDTPRAAAPLDANQPAHRYLRLCPEDVDHYRLPLAEGQTSLRLGLARIEPPSGVQIALPQSAVPPATDPWGLGPAVPSLGSPDSLLPTPPSGIALELLQSAGETLAAVPVEITTDGPQGPDPVDQVLEVGEEQLSGKEAVLRVRGEPSFYHLTRLDQPNQDQQQDPDDQDEDSDPQDEPQQEDGEQGQEKEREPQQEDGEQGQEKEKEPQQQEDGEQGQEKEKEPQQQPESPGDAEERGEEGKDEEPAKEPEPSTGEEAKQQPEPGQEQEPQGGQHGEPGEEEVEARRVEDILRALEQSDDNFQMRKALEHMPGRYIDKDW